MKYLSTIESCAKRIESNVRMIRNLEVLKENGFEFDIFNNDGPLYEDDDNKLESHISFYQSLLEEDIKMMADRLNMEVNTGIAYWKRKFGEVMCSECFCPIEEVYMKDYKYCPECGRKMVE